MFATFLANEQGQLSLFWLIFAGAAAAITGDNPGFLLGRKLGRRLIRSIQKIARLDDLDIDAGKELTRKMAQLVTRYHNGLVTRCVMERKPRTSISDRRLCIYKAYSGDGNMLTLNPNHCSHEHADCGRRLRLTSSTWMGGPSTKFSLSSMVVRSTFRVLLVVLLASPLSLPQEVEPSPSRGEAIFQQRCAKCHGANGEGVSAAVTIAGPRIQAVHNPGDVMLAMEVGPSHMPSFAHVLTVSEMRDVADYVTQKLAVIPQMQGDLAEGGSLFRIYCAACHRTALRGGALAFTDSNAPDLSHKSAAIIAGAIRWGPGAMPSFPPAVLDDKQLNSIVEYAKFVQQPPAPGGSPLHWYGPVAEGFVAWLIVFTLIALAGWIERGETG